MRPHHKEALIKWLYRGWKIIGARRLVRKYGVEDITTLVFEMRERGFYHKDNNPEGIRNRTAFLVWALKSLEEDRMGGEGDAAD